MTGIFGTEKGDFEGAVVIPSLADKSLPAVGSGSMLLNDRFERYPALLATSWVNYELPGKSIGIEAQSNTESQDAFISISAAGNSESPSYGSEPTPF